MIEVVIIEKKYMIGMEKIHLNHAYIGSFDYRIELVVNLPLL